MKIKGRKDGAVTSAVERSSILVVEDNDDLRLVLRTELEDEFDLFEAPNGKVGLSLTLDHLPDLVIADYMMPVMNGLDLCREPKANKSTVHIPVVILTARSALEHQLEGLENGADDYITRPFEISLLKARIRNLISSRRLLLGRFEQPKGNPVTPAPRQETDSAGGAEDFLQRVTAVIEEKMHDFDFGVGQLATLLHINRTTLLTRIKTLANQTPQDFIRTMRLLKSKSLLEGSSLTISQISMEVGILEATNFSRSFKHEFGVTPSEFRTEKNSNNQFMVRK